VTNGGSGYTSATVTIAGDGTGAAAVAIVDPATGTITTINVTNPGTRYTTATVTIAGDGTGAAAAATTDYGTILSVAVTNGGTGYTTAGVSIIGGGGTGAVAEATIAGGAITGIAVTNPGTGYNSVPGIRKFVDGLPGLGAAGANDLGQYIPVAVPDTTTYPGSDYYVIGLGEYTEKLHADLPPTKLRGYRQENGSDNRYSYLGPIIVAQKDRPVRVKFINRLPTGTGGDLFIPVDTTVMGAGMGPNGGNYTENRATLHLHGGNTPWISDGTQHQWTTPAGESTN
jgi:hypothetical protein